MGTEAGLRGAAWFLLPHQHLSVLLLNHIRDLAGVPGGPDGKRLSAMRESRVRSLGREDPLEKEMAARSSTVAWRIPRSEMPGGRPSTGSQGDTTERLHSANQNRGDAPALLWG